MRLPLGIRVVTLVTAFNVAVFGGLLAWFTQRLSAEQTELASIDEQLVLERLRNLLDEKGQALTGEILSWSRWSRYEDAQIVQLWSFEAGGGLKSDLRQVGLSGRPAFIPDGYLIPLRRPRPGPRNLWLPFEHARLPDGGWLPPILPAAVGYSLPLILSGVRVRVRLPRMEPGDVWGAGLLLKGSPWPEEPQTAFVAADLWGLMTQLSTWPRYLAGALGSMTYLGLSPSRQRDYDRSMSAHLRAALITARRAGVVIPFRGGILLPLTESGGRVWGAGFFPFRTWLSLLPTPWFSPPRWVAGAIIDPLEEDPSPADLEVRGIFLNPMGSAHRSANWDQEAVFADIRRAAFEGAPVPRTDAEGASGLAVPLRLSSGQLWGGVWLRPRRESLAGPLLRELGPWFLLSTTLLTLATFFGIHRLVLDPVRRLARGARRLRSGDLRARVPEVARRDELADLVRSFNGMAEEVEGFNARLAHEVKVATTAARDAEAAAMTQRRLAATGELAAGIAHEINNPLGGLLNALEVLRKGELKDSTRTEYLALVQGGLERIGETVGKVLRLAPRETRVELLSLVGPMEDALGLVRHRAHKQGTQVLLMGVGGERSMEVPGALEPWRRLPPVRGQQNELGQAILNLLVNALDALEEVPGGKGEIRVGMETEGTDLHLWIADDGPGMDPDVAHRAADLFFTTKQTGRGTGLGLAIVHNVVAGHGGRVQLSAPEVGGFLVDVWLPLAADVRLPDGESGEGEGQAPQS